MLRSIANARQTGFADFQARLVAYACGVDQLHSPERVLNELHLITTKASLSVLGAARFPPKISDWDSIRLGESAFLHGDVPKGWWEEYSARTRGKFRPALFLASSSMAAFTWTEVLRMFQPIGVDRYGYELALRYGMRDGLTCPVGGRWLVAFWSRRELSRILTQQVRVVIVGAATFAALRLEQLTGPDARRNSLCARLTPRELAVLRLVSTGAQSAHAAEQLGLGEETVRSHLKKAQTKLGAHGRTHAVAEALRHGLIP